MSAEAREIVACGRCGTLVLIGKSSDGVTTSFVDANGAYLATYSF